MLDKEWSKCTLYMLYTDSRHKGIPYMCSWVPNFSQFFSMDDRLQVRGHFETKVTLNTTKSKVHYIRNQYPRVPNFTLRTTVFELQATVRQEHQIIPKSPTVFQVSGHLGVEVKRQLKQVKVKRLADDMLLQKWITTNIFNWELFPNKNLNICCFRILWTSTMRQCMPHSFNKRPRGLNALIELDPVQKNVLMKSFRWNRLS